MKNELLKSNLQKLILLKNDPLKKYKSWKLKQKPLVKHATAIFVFSIQKETIAFQLCFRYEYAKIDTYYV